MKLNKILNSIKWFIVLYMGVINFANANDIICYKDQKKLIQSLYNYFPFQGSASVKNADKKLLSIFFTTKLTNLIIKDQINSMKGTGVCNIDFDILTHQQDEPVDEKYRILKRTKNVVRVGLNYQDHIEILNFKFESVDQCQYISDVNYSWGKSLVGILKRKC